MPATLRSSQFPVGKWDRYASEPHGLSELQTTYKMLPQQKSDCVPTGKAPGTTACCKLQQADALFARGTQFWSTAGQILGGNACVTYAQDQDTCTYYARRSMRTAKRHKQRDTGRNKYNETDLRKTNKQSNGRTSMCLFGSSFFGASQPDARFHMFDANNLANF